MHLRIGIPAYRSIVDVKTAFCLSGIMYLSKVRNWEISFSSVDNPNIDKARNKLMYDALNVCPNADWFLSIDSDNNAPPHQVIQMIEDAIKMSNNCSIIGAPYKSRAGGLAMTMEGNKQVMGISGSKGIFPIDAIGFGMALFNLDWIRSNWPNKNGPWFKTIQLEKAESLTEDFVFCEEVKKLGGSIWCDSRVDCGHETNRVRG